MRQPIDHPSPQFRRESYELLNGRWDFRFDDTDSGLNEGWQRSFEPQFDIQVPFVYQCELSGINDKTFHPIVWYQREIDCVDLNNSRYLLHFEGVDYETTLWVNGQYAASHIGGNSRFTVDITPFVNEGVNKMVLRVKDDLKDMTIPRGKQYWKEEAEVMWFTQMTGIWRDVWLEATPKMALKNLRLTPQINSKSLDVSISTTILPSNTNVSLGIKVLIDGEVILEDIKRIFDVKTFFSLGLPDFNDHGLGHWWSPESPNLYDLELDLIVNGERIDHVKSYFGMRQVSVEKNKFCLNNRPYFMRMVLDQGYFKESILTPPSFEALERDVLLTKELGFNSVRKHMMSCDSRYLYLCDFHGLAVWSEMAAAYDYSEQYAYQMIDEWKSIVTDFYNHPSIVTYTPLNESWGVPEIYYSSKQQAHAQSLYYITKSVDDTRPVISNDGWEHCQSDLFTVHDYESNVEILTDRYSSVENIIDQMPGLGGRKFLYCPGYEYEGQPVLCTEMGGVNYRLNGLGMPVEPRESSEGDFLKKIKDILNVYYSSKIIEGICYTQLTDTETEICGLLTWNREPKASLEKLRKVIEKGEL